MTKARIITRHEAEEAINRRRANKKRAAQTAKKPVEAVREWVEQHRAQRPSPRQAFAALFAQPQPQ
jgi:hypothetical protein